jgi:hypothetical protein
MHVIVFEMAQVAEVVHGCGRLLSSREPDDSAKRLGAILEQAAKDLWELRRRLREKGLGLLGEAEEAERSENPGDPQEVVIPRSQPGLPSIGEGVARLDNRTAVGVRLACETVEASTTSNERNRRSRSAGSLAKAATVPGPTSGASGLNWLAVRSGNSHWM